MPYKLNKDIYANRRLGRKVKAEREENLRHVTKPVVQCISCGRLSIFGGTIKKNRHNEGCPQLKS